MAYDTNFQATLSLPAAGDLSAFQFYPVTVTTSATYPDGAVTTISSTTTKPIGILQDVPDAAGVMAAVVVAGISKCRVYTGTVNPLDSIGVHASGYGEVTTTDNRWVVGDVMDTASTDLNEFPVLTVNVNIHRY